MLFDTQLNKIKCYYRTNRHLPDYKKAAEVLSCKSKGTSSYMVKKLIKEGCIRRKGNKLLPGYRFKGLPYYRSVRAGFPGPAEEETNDTISLDEYLIERPNSTTLMKVAGKNMARAGILEGDIAIVERTGLARAGEIVAMAIEEGIIIGYMIYKDKKPVLSFADADYPPLHLEYHKSTLLMGVVKGIVRKY